MISQKTLYILRHAKAAGGQDDHARPLAERGIEEARQLGKYLAKNLITTEQVLCSTSARTRQTWEYVAQTSGATWPIDYTKKLYLSSVEDQLALVAETSETMSRLMIVGHNPSLQELCIKLIRSGDEALCHELSGNFPPASFAAIRFDAMAWADIARGDGRLELFVTPN